MANTLKNAIGIGKAFVEDITSPVRKAADLSRYAYGLNPDYSLAKDMAKIVVGKGSDVVRRAKNWINSEDAPSAPRPTPKVPGVMIGDDSSGLGIPTSPQPVPQSSPAAQAMMSEPVGAPFAFRAPEATGANTGANYVPMVEPELTTFSPDDARYAQRQAQIAERESRSQANIRNAIAARETSDAGLKRSNSEEDRKIAAADRERRIAQEDREEAWRADQRRLDIQQKEEEIARRTQWSRERGGLPWTAQAEAEDLKREQDRSVADEQESSIRELNVHELELMSGLDAMAAGGTPNDPNLVAAIESITGRPFASMNYDPATIEKIRPKILSQIERERVLATEKAMSLLKLLKVNRSEKDSELPG